MTTPANRLPLHADHPPLRVDEGGAVRVGHTRVSLDLVVEQYENRMTPEDMVRASWETVAERTDRQGTVASGACVVLTRAPVWHDAGQVFR